MKPYTYIPRKPWDSKSCRFSFFFMAMPGSLPESLFPTRDQATPQRWTGKNSPNLAGLEKSSAKVSFAKRLSGEWKTNDKRGVKNIHNSHAILSYLTMSLVVTTIESERTKWFRREERKEMNGGLIGSVVKNLPIQEARTNPWSGKISQRSWSN